MYRTVRHNQFWITLGPEAFMGARSNTVSLIFLGVSVSGNGGTEASLGSALLGRGYINVSMLMDLPGAISTRIASKRN